jgi:hypothetical protein
MEIRTKPSKRAKNVGKAKTSASTKPLETKKAGAEGKSTNAKPQKQVSTVGNPNIAEAGKATRFQPGVSPNPGGKPVGSRNKLQGDFMRELCEDFAANGRNAIIACRTEKPDAYVKIIASLMPKEFEIKRPLEELSEDELVAGVAALQSFLASSSNGDGVTATTQRKQTH